MSVLGCRIVGFAVLLATGCSSSGGGSGSASAAAAKVQETCDDAARRYGEHVAKMMENDAKNPIPKDKRKLVSEPIRDATVASCKEDKWEELPLSCLAAVFNNPPKDDDKLDEYTDVCIKSVGKEKLASMDQRVARAMADAVLGPRASASAAAPPAGDSAAPAASGTASAAPQAAAPTPGGPGAPTPKAASPKPAPAPAPPKPPKPAGDVF